MLFLYVSSTLGVSVKLIYVLIMLGQYIRIHIHTSTSRPAIDAYCSCARVIPSTLHLSCLPCTRQPHPTIPQATYLPSCTISLCQRQQPFNPFSRINTHPFTNPFCAPDTSRTHRTHISVLLLFSKQPASRSRTDTSIPTSQPAGSIIRSFPH